MQCICLSSSLFLFISFSLSFSFFLFSLSLRFLGVVVFLLATIVYQFTQAGPDTVSNSLAVAVDLPEEGQQLIDDTSYTQYLNAQGEWVYTQGMSDSSFVDPGPRFHGLSPPSPIIRISVIRMALLSSLRMATIL